jgi:hypothetical protein
MFHIRLWQFNANREHTDSQDDAGDFKRDLVDCFVRSASPRARIEYVGTIRSYDNTKNEGEACFTNVKLRKLREV